MSKKQIKQLNEITTIEASDMFVVQKNSSDATNKVKAENIYSVLVEVNEAWHEVGEAGEPAFENSWVNYDGGTSHESCAYMKDAQGFVHLKGLVKNGSSLTAIIFTLPTGYRPNLTQVFNTTSNNAYCRLDVFSSGEVKVVVGGSTTYVSLAGIIFRAEQ